MSATFLLLTIPLSHFCEKARWALERSGLGFMEEGHAPLFSRLATRRYGAPSTVPLLLTPDGALRDSNAILRHVDLSLAPDDRLFSDDPAILALVDRLDRDLGPHVRRLAYFHLLQDRALMVSLLGDRVPRMERFFLRLFFPVLRMLMRRGMRIDAEGARRSRLAIDQVFADVAALLADGRRYLFEDRLTAADLTLAALAAPVLLPGRHPVLRLPLDALPAAMRQEVERLRVTPVGRHVLRVYEEDRRRPSLLYNVVP